MCFRQWQKLLSNSNPGKLVEAGTGYLEEHHVEEPRRNAEILLEHILKKPACYLYTQNEAVASSTVERYLKMLRKRATHVPLQYITREVAFYRDVFLVRKGVFIPRPETEILVEKTVALYKKYLAPDYVRVLDIGTGCGNIAVSLAKEIENCSVVATDVSKTALEVSLRNALRHRVKSKIRFFKSDIFPPGKGKFNMIVSNPPYISAGDMVTLPEDIRREPARALSGGADGTSVIGKILQSADRLLHYGGFLLLEIGYDQADFIRDFRCNLKLTGIEKDLSGIERVGIFQKSKSRN